MNIQYSLWLVGVILLSGCSWFGGDDADGEIKPADLKDINDEVSIVRVWSSSLTGADEKYRVSLRPSAREGRLFAANHQGDVFALGLAGGNKIWKTELGVSLSGGVGSGGGLVLVGSIEGKVYAINAANGTVSWERQMETEVLTAPQSNGNIVVVQTIDDKIYALRSDNGEELWRHDGNAPILSVRGTSSPLVTDNMVLAGFDSGKLVAFNTANGSLIWETRLALPKGRTELQRMVDIDGDPLLVGDVIYSASYQGRLGAITRGTGRQLWSQESSSHQTPAFGGDKVFVTEADDRIRAFEAGSGRGVWTNDDLFLRRLTAPVIFGDYIAVADSFGYLHLLNMEDGLFVGRTKLDSSGISAPMVVNADLLIVQANSGLVVSLHIEPR